VTLMFRIEPGKGEGENLKKRSKDGAGLNF
jgi:hypothetical protein